MSDHSAVGSRGTGLREVREAVQQANLLRRLEQSTSAACDSGCEGRCRECPADAIREAIAILAALSALPLDAHEVCICAAIRLEDGRIIRGHRHDDCIQTALKWRAAGQDIKDGG